MNLGKGENELAFILNADDIRPFYSRQSGLGFSDRIEVKKKSRRATKEFFFWTRYALPINDRPIYTLYRSLSTFAVPK